MGKADTAAKQFRYLKLGRTASDAMLGYSDYDSIDDIPDAQSGEILNGIHDATEAQKSLDWLRTLAKRLEPAKRLKDAGPANEVWRAAQREAEAILSTPGIEEINPRVLRLCFTLGCKITAGGMAGTFGGKVASAQKISAVNSQKSKPRLTDLEFREVVKAIDRELDRGGDLGPSCEALAKQLTTGACRILPGRKVKIGGSALRKRYNKIKVGNTV